MPQNHKTDALTKASSSAKQKLSHIAAIIALDYLGITTLHGSIWDFHIRDGSLTFQHKGFKNRIIKITIDQNQSLCKEIGIILTSLNPIVIGIEIENGYELPFEKTLIRDGLSRKFPFYVDPRISSNDTWCLKPIYDHPYDIIFLDDKDASCHFTKRHQKLADSIEKELP